MAGLPHRAIYGVSLSGKTWRAKRLAAALLKRKQQVIVYSGQADRDWRSVGPASRLHYTESEDQIEEYLNTPDLFEAHVFLDECTDLFRLTKRSTHRALHNCTKKGRHRGFTVYLIDHEPVGLPTYVRNNAKKIDAFCMGRIDYAETICRDASIPKEYAARMINLPQLNFFEFRPFKEPVLRKLA